MIRTAQTTQGIWQVRGINMLPTDAIYKTTVEAIENRWSPEKLQQKTGHLAPIDINYREKIIDYHRF